MTCIVGVEHQGRVWIGADALITDSYWTKDRAAHPKVFQGGEFLIGWSGSVRMGQLLQYALTVPARLPEQSEHGYLCTTFVDAVRDCLRAGGNQIVKDEAAAADGRFLLGYAGALYAVAQDYQVFHSRRGYAACGGGATYALGSLHATAKNPDPEERIRLALDAASTFSADCGGPFTVIPTDPDATSPRLAGEQQ